jgi:PAS domain S-box-containing protein
LKETRNTIVGGLALAGIKLALAPIHEGALAAGLSALTDCGFSILLGVAAWRASRRSRRYAQALWLCFALAAGFWALSFAIDVFLSLRSASFSQAMTEFWPTTIIFYLVGIALAAPLLLREEGEHAGIEWVQTLDIAQLGIVTFSAYLVFYYLPSISSLSNASRVRNFMILHFMRDGFLALCFFYRAWRSRFRSLRRLQFLLAVFFVAFGVVEGPYLTAVNGLHWPIPLLDMIGDLPLIFLLIIGATWKQTESIRTMETAKQTSDILWAQLLPVILPITVAALASRAPREYLQFAWIAVSFSIVCYAGRLLVMQQRQKTLLSQMSVLEERFSKAFRSSPAAITISRLSDGKCIDANDRWLEMAQLRREDVIGRTSIELGIWENPEDRSALVEAVRREGSVRRRPTEFRMAGKKVVALVSAEPIEFGGETLLITSLLDVTELQNVTQQLRQAQKMELVGSLAGGVAHDFNNLLTIIKGYSELAQMKEETSAAEEEIQQIVEATDRAAALTRQLLAFSRRQVLQPRNIDLNRVVGGIEKLLRRTIGEHIKLVTNFAPNLGTVHADPLQMEQVVINLAINARDAMPNGGTLLFDTKNQDFATPYAERNFEIPLGRYVLLAVTDDGTGIAPEMVDRLFEPFFTTKEIGRGTGLGLSTVYGIIKQSGGFIWVYSEVGVGTTFKVCLPRVDQPAETATRPETAAEDLRGTETILVVEDDPRVRELTARILREYGYKVLAAESGEEALRQAERSTGEIHLLLTDVIMSRAKGTEFAKQLKAKLLRLEVVYMSGYPHFSSSARDPLDFRDRLLTKPFSPSELARKVRAALNRG